MSIFANLLIQSGAIVDPRLLSQPTPKDLQLEREATRVVTEDLTLNKSVAQSNDCEDQSA